jgi:hypothetical protein
MTRANDIAWRRFLIEAGVIVASILLAFGIDAWWENRQTYQWQLTQLSELRNEFAENQAQLSSMAKSHDAIASYAQAIAEKGRLKGVGETLALKGNELSALITWRTSDIATGSLETLLASGRLNDIQNGDIRRALAAWPTRVSDAQEDENLARDFVESTVVPGLLGDGVLVPAYRGRPYPGRQPRAGFDEQTHTIKVTTELIELATIRSVHSLMAGGSIRDLELEARRILDLLDAELGESKAVRPARLD